MAVIQGMLESMALHKDKYLEKWDGAQKPIKVHILKLALIIDDYNQKKWFNEIDTQLTRLSGYEIKSKLNEDTFQRVYNDHCYENQVGLKRDIKYLIDGYCTNESNMNETAYVREWESGLEWVEAKTNTIFKQCVSLVRDHQLGIKEYKKGDVAKDSVIKAILDEFHAIKEFKVWKHTEVVRVSN